VKSVEPPREPEVEVHFPCDLCEATGQTPEGLCRVCDGTAFVKHRVSITTLTGLVFEDVRDK
jgi:hypothetical protein